MEMTRNSQLNGILIAYFNKMYRSIRHALRNYNLLKWYYDYHRVPRETLKRHARRDSALFLRQPCATHRVSPVLSSFLWQYLHCSGAERVGEEVGEDRGATLTSIPFHRRFARKRRKAGEEWRLGPRKSIYLFIYVPRGGLGLTRGCGEARLIVGACIEPGIPRERPARDEGMTAEVTENGTRIFDSAGLSGSTRDIQGVYLFARLTRGTLHPPSRRRDKSG